MNTFILRSYGKELTVVNADAAKELYEEVRFFFIRFFQWLAFVLSGSSNSGSGDINWDDIMPNW